MSYSRGFLNRRVTILHRKDTGAGGFGFNSGGMDWVPVKTVWANIYFQKGTKAMMEGALDAYDTVLIRMDCHAELDRNCRLQHKSRVYSINSYNPDEQKNEVTITATEIVNPGNVSGEK